MKMCANLNVAENERVYIRLLTTKDTNEILKWRNSTNVVKNFIFRKSITKEMHEDWIRTQINEGKVIQFIIGDKSLNIEVGSVYFKNIDSACKSCEYGIFIAEEAEGRGIGYQATLLAIEYMFNKYEFEYITLRVLKKNKKAIHMYEKCGFKDIKQNMIVEVENGSEEVIFMKLDR